MSYAYPGLFCVYTLFRWVPVALSARSEDFKDASVKAGVIAIATHFSGLPKTNRKLEEHGLSLEGSTNLVENLLQELKSIPPGMKPIYGKLQGVLDANTGYGELLKI